MNLVEVLERCGQLCQDGPRIAEVHAADVVALERVDEALVVLVAQLLDLDIVLLDAVLESLHELFFLVILVHTPFRFCSYI